MSSKNVDLLIATLIAVINIAWTQVPYHFLLVDIVFALPLIFLLPGYTLTQVLFRGRLSTLSPQVASDLVSRPHLKVGRPIGGADQLVLSLGLSLALDVLVGFALNIFPMGLQRLSWTLSLGLLTTIFTLLAVLLRRSGGMMKVSKTPKVRISAYEGILLFAAILVVVLAIWISMLRPIQPQPSFTQFWMLPANPAGQSCAVSIGLQNFESTSVAYRIVMKVNDVQTTTWSSIVLVPQGKWVRSVSVGSGAAGNQYIEAQLFRVDKPGVVYRNVHLTFHDAPNKENRPHQQQCILGTA
jgi:uncharacterized membrane protein